MRNDSESLKNSQAVQAASLLPPSPRAIAECDFEPADGPQVDDFVIVGPVVAVNDHFVPAGCECDEVFVFDGQPAAIGHVDYKRAKGAGVHQLSNLVGLHAANHAPRAISSKGKGRPMRPRIRGKSKLAILGGRNGAEKVIPRLSTNCVRRPALGASTGRR